MLLAALLLAAAAQAGETCWHKGEGPRGPYYYFGVGEPAGKFVVDYGPKRLRRAADLAAVVANGTFFSGARPLGDVVDSEGRRFHPSERRLRAADGRMVDLGLRWGVGRLRGRLVVATGDQARDAGLEPFLGGGAALLLGGQDAVARNRPRRGVWGESFPADILDASRARTALGLKMGADGVQRLVLLSVPERSGMTAAEAAAALRALGATDAVLFDGGGARGLSARSEDGGRLFEAPAEREDLNPTRVGLRACR